MVNLYDISIAWYFFSCEFRVTLFIVPFYLLHCLFVLRLFVPLPTPQFTYVIVQGDSLARGPKLLSIKNYVIEILT